MVWEILCQKKCSKKLRPILEIKNSELHPQVHRLIGHQGTMTSNEIQKAVSAIYAFMKRWRKFMPVSEFPKLHILETHCIYTLTKIQTGFGVSVSRKCLHRIIKNIFQSNAFALKRQDYQFMFVLELLCLRALVKMKKDGLMDF